jgi:hypothetical protein
MPLTSLTPADLQSILDLCRESIDRCRKRAEEAKARRDYQVAAEDLQMMEQYSRIATQVEKAIKLARH